MVDKVAVLNILYEDGDERNSAYIADTHCFYVDNDLSEKVKNVISKHVKEDEYNASPDFLDEVDSWILNSEDDLLSITVFKQAYLEIVSIS